MFAVKINPAQKKEINRIAQSFSLKKNGAINSRST